MAARAAFVGREGELSRLLAALGGGARLVLVVGDAGIGKTRFADEGMARAAAAEAAPTPVEAGTLDVTANVTLSVEVSPVAR